MDSKVGSHWSFRKKRDISSSLHRGRDRAGEKRKEEKLPFGRWYRTEMTCSFVWKKVWFGSYLEKAKLLKSLGLGLLSCEIAIVKHIV